MASNGSLGLPAHLYRCTLEPLHPSPWLSCSLWRGFFPLSLTPVALSILKFRDSLTSLSRQSLGGCRCSCLPLLHALLWDNAFSSISLPHLPFQLHQPSRVGIYLWAARILPSHTFPGWAGISPDCLSNQIGRIKTLLSQEHPGGNRSPTGSHQQATKGPFRGAFDALVLAEVPGAHVALYYRQKLLTLHLLRGAPHV